MRILKIKGGIALPETVNEKRLRQSNIELLRIVSMIMIVAHHFSVHGNFKFPIDTLTVNRLWTQFIQMGGKIGVDIFVLISGYFLVSSVTIKKEKVIKLWLQIFTYSVVLFLGLAQIPKTFIITIPLVLKLLY